ncbi:hypothetical protein DVH24_011219 [Malus domestica]|uniref:Glycolipid transfer protein domain-containing protein n=1 Tax=Malus domestica TaxID=3750 RepID=A0A498JYM1_MALDO|nr:hypothetical protein DVH24_011219 [Malus domestica]
MFILIRRKDILIPKWSIDLHVFKHPQIILFISSPSLRWYAAKQTNISRHKSKILTLRILVEREREERERAAMTDEKPLRKIAEAFKELEAAVNSQAAEVEVAPFSRACSLVSPLFGCLGIAFKFAEMDYVAKVHDLSEASNSISTLQVLLDRDIEAGCVRKGGSHSRNLLRVKRGIDMVRVLFEQIIVTKGNSLKDPASKAYAQVFAPHHGWVIRKAVAAGIELSKSSNAELHRCFGTSNSVHRQTLPFEEIGHRLVEQNLHCTYGDLF